MSWDEVKKINSDMKVPLDVYQYLNDYKLWGKESYVYQDKTKLHKLYETSVVSMNDLELSGEALEYLVINNKHIGKALGNVYGIGGKDTLSTLPTMSAVLASSTAMSAVLASSTAMSAIAASSTAMSAIAASSTAMSAVLASSTAIAGICKANYNTTKEIINAINNNNEYIKKVYDIVTTSSDFKNTTNICADNVISLNRYCNIPDTIIFCALGYYKTGNGSTSLFINNKAIKTLSRAGGSNPQSVNRNNCSAIAVPTATFTENEDGYAAIAVYQAI